MFQKWLITLLNLLFLIYSLEIEAQTPPGATIRAIRFLSRLFRSPTGQLGTNLPPNPRRMNILPVKSLESIFCPLDTPINR
jgi:hypothetical protein